MQNIMSTFISLAWIICSFAAQSMESSDSIIVYDLPESSKTMTLDPKSYLIKDGLDSVIDLCQRGEQAPKWKVITYVTPREAAASFYTYLEEKVGKEEAKKLATTFFSSAYFGLEYPSSKRVSDPREDACKAPYLFDGLSSWLSYGITDDFGLVYQMTSLNDSDRFNLKTLLLTPKQIFDAFVSHSDHWENYQSKLGTKDFEEFKRIRPKLVEGLFCERLMGIPSSPEERKKHLLTKPIGFFSQDLIARIHAVAQRMIKSSKSGDTFVIFGNTPYFVGRALRKLASKNSNDDNYRQIIDFPFSGSPNRTRQVPDARDIVTSERLEHLKVRLVANGLSSTNSKMREHSTHFVDVIASGAGVAYVLEEILRDFKKADIPYPHMDIFCLNQINISNKEDLRNARISLYDIQDGESNRFFFPTREKQHFSVMSHVFYLKGHALLDMLPSDEWRVFPEYNASYWLKEYDWMLTQEPANHTKVLLEYFDMNLSHILETMKL